MTLTVDDIRDLYVPFKGPFDVWVSGTTDEVVVEDSEGSNVCLFNRYTQLPIMGDVDDLLEFERQHWIEKAHQICELLNIGWEIKNA